VIPHFATLGPAPRSVRVARVVCPLVMCFAYLTLRVAPAAHDRIALGELITSGVLFVGLTFLAFIALGDLIDPEPLPPRLELEKVAAAASALRADFPAHRGRIEGDLLATLGGDWPGRAEAKRELIARGYGYDPADAVTEELELLTHEYVPQHHTPARGFLAPALAKVADEIATAARTAQPIRTTGRHRKA